MDDVSSEGANIANPDDDAVGAVAEEATGGPVRKRPKGIPRPYPRKTLDESLRVPNAIKAHNGGNPWVPKEVAKALSLAMSSNFYYLTAASRDFGLTVGTRDTATIEITELGRKAVYPPSPEAETEAKLEAFFGVEIFDRVLRHYGGNNLPEKRFLANTLEAEFGLDPSIHDEFADLFVKNCEYLGIGASYTRGDKLQGQGETSSDAFETGAGPAQTLALPAAGPGDGKVCFIIMPFTERSDRHPVGFFDEVLNSVFKRAASEAGFEVKTARRKGSDVIQATIVQELLKADLVLADLTEHNPNVLFELGMRMAEDKPTALVRAKGTGSIFDVDNMLRVEEYSPNLWPSTVAEDLPKIRDHVKATWDNRDIGSTFLKILSKQTPG